MACVVTGDMRDFPSSLGRLSFSASPLPASNTRSVRTERVGGSDDSTLPERLRSYVSARGGCSSRDETPSTLEQCIDICPLASRRCAVCRAVSGGEAMPEVRVSSSGPRGGGRASALMEHVSVDTGDETSIPVVRDDAPDTVVGGTAEGPLLGQFSLYGAGAPRLSPSSSFAVSDRNDSPSTNLRHNLVCRHVVAAQGSGSRRSLETSGPLAPQQRPLGAQGVGVCEQGAMGSKPFLAPRRRAGG